MGGIWTKTIQGLTLDPLLGTEWDENHADLLLGTQIDMLQKEETQTGFGFAQRPSISKLALALQ